MTVTRRPPGTLRSVVGLLEPGELDQLRRVAAWSRRPVVGVVVDEIRRQLGRSGRQRIRRTKHLTDYLEHTAMTSVVTPLDAAINLEQQQWWSQLFAQMSPRRQLVLAGICNNTPQRQIADACGCSVAAIDYHVRQIKRIIRGALSARRQRELA